MVEAIKDFVWFYFLGGKREFLREQEKLAYMMFHTPHDISMLPGGYYIHHSFCDACKEKADTHGE